MNTNQQILARRVKVEAASSPFKRILSQVARLSEPFWFCVSFLLFLVMGPFSVIAVVYGLWSLASEENRQKMIEPASC